MEEKQTNEGFNEEMLPTIENFEWLPEFEKILKTFMLKAPIEKVGVAVYEKMSFFKPPLSQVRNFVAHNLKMLTFFRSLSLAFLIKLRTIWLEQLLTMALKQTLCFGLICLSHMLSILLDMTCAKSFSFTTLEECCKSKTSVSIWGY